MTGRTVANRSRTVKTRVEKLFVWSISPARRSFFCGKSRIAFRKDGTFLPQGSSCGCRKRGKTGLRRAFPALDGVRPHANPVCPFASHSPAELTRGRVPAARRSVAGDKMSRKPAFGFHPAFPWARMVRVFPFCSRPTPVCAVLASAVLTF